MAFPWHCLCGTLILDGLDQVGDASLENEQERRHGMTGAEWRVATALFTAGEVTTCTHLNRKSTIQYYEMSDERTSLLSRHGRRNWLHQSRIEMHLHLQLSGDSRRQHCPRQAESICWSLFKRKVTKEL